MSSVVENNEAVKRRAFGYCRVSTARQANEGESLAVQRELIQAICTLEGLECIDVFVEEAVSGSRPLSTRPQGSALLAALKPGDVVVALRLDRMFRDVGDAAATLADLKRRGVRLYLKDVGGFVSGDSVGELVFALLSSVAAFERSRTRERIVDVKRSLAAQGQYLGGDIPFGHDLVEVEGKRTVQLNSSVVDEVRRLRSLGYSSRLIAGHFAQQGKAVSHHAVNRFVKKFAAAA